MEVVVGVTCFLCGIWGDFSRDELEKDKVIIGRSKEIEEGISSCIFGVDCYALIFISELLFLKGYQR
jgi:hypothetical protein